MGLHQWTGEAPSYARLPLDEFAARLRLALPFVHVVGQRRDLLQGAIYGIVHEVESRRRATHELLELRDSFRRCLPYS